MVPPKIEQKIEFVGLRIEFGVVDIEFVVGIEFELVDIVVGPELADIESVGIEVAGIVVEVAGIVFEVAEIEIDSKAVEIGSEVEVALGLDLEQFHYYCY